MLLLPQVFVVASLWTYTSGDILVTPLMTSITKRRGNTAFLECRIKTDRLKKNAYIHWYRQKPDRKLDADMAPKPTIFFPSIAEINLDKAGTHLCLLENFFPDAIKVHWKAKDSNTVLESQQGNTIMTNDTYMKFSWLTVPEKSMDTEHICVVKHENNKGGIDQEIHFPPINQDTVRLQRESTSAYYAYLLLLLKSGLYFCVVAFLLLRRTAVCGHGKGS
ncbi:hypothetical protein CB1_000803038 [Camelus ferus]|nr:hypothetical protein CB1_000803038 [Camelus ferus]